jgi:hypothetical protein
MSFRYDAGRQINYEEYSKKFRLSFSRVQVLCIGKLLRKLLHYCLHYQLDLMRKMDCKI